MQLFCFFGDAGLEQIRVEYNMVFINSNLYAVYANLSHNVVAAEQCFSFFLIICFEELERLPTSTLKCNGYLGSSLRGSRLNDRLSYVHIAIEYVKNQVYLGVVHTCLQTTTNVLVSTDVISYACQMAKDITNVPAMQGTTLRMIYTHAKV